MGLVQKIHDLTIAAIKKTSINKYNLCYGDEQVLIKTAMEKQL